MPTKKPSRRRARRSLDEAISALGWKKLTLWSAAAAVPVAIAANTFWLLIETLLPPSMARGAELVPYVGGMFLATVVGQLLGPYAGLRRQLEMLEPGYRVWFNADNPLAKLNRILWNMGTEAQSAAFRSLVSGVADEFTEQRLDKGRTKLLTAISQNLESVPRLFHVRGVNRKEMTEFGATPPEESLVSLARRLREVDWGRVELRPNLEWLAYPPVSIVGALVLLAAMILLLALAPVSRPGSEGFGVFFGALALQWPFYFAAIAFFMLPSAGRPSGIVRSALPSGLPTTNLDESLDLATDPFQRVRLFLGALPPDDQKALLEATHYALWKAVRTYSAGSRVRTSRSQQPASGI
jgi:hypothetical protein